MNEILYEALGIIATLFVLVSFLFTNEKRIRQINIIGAVLFVIYGVIIGAHAVYILNGALIFIHIYKLLKQRNAKEGTDESDS